MKTKLLCILLCFTPMLIAPPYEPEESTTSVDPETKARLDALKNRLKKEQEQRESDARQYAESSKKESQSRRTPESKAQAQETSSNILPEKGPATKTEIRMKFAEKQRQEQSDQEAAVKKEAFDKEQRKLEREKQRQFKAEQEAEEQARQQKKQQKALNDYYNEFEHYYKTNPRELLTPDPTTGLTPFESAMESKDIVLANKIADIVKNSKGAVKSSELLSPIIDKYNELTKTIADKSPENKEARRAARAQRQDIVDTLDAIGNERLTSVFLKNTESNAPAEPAKIPQAPTFQFDPTKSIEENITRFTEENSLKGSSSQDIQKMILKTLDAQVQNIQFTFYDDMTPEEIQQLALKKELALKALGLDNPEVIRSAYKKLVIKWHPDKNTTDTTGIAEAVFKIINEANSLLSNPQAQQA